MRQNVISRGGTLESLIRFSLRSRRAIRFNERSKARGVKSRRKHRRGSTERMLNECRERENVVYLALNSYNDYNSSTMSLSDSSVHRSSTFARSQRDQFISI
ncbi:hypothetical protein PUN28_017646 [Cardiocondyla obscurior]|uniref:Uncharacterized protein n=1 Tax=Cardiocondyla obscurior TaxID=286306 RepID=A0AAW2EK00_9HYME